MDQQIHILMLEDDAPDAELVQRELRKAGLDFTMEWTQGKSAFLRALERLVPDLILADYAVPGFDGLAALRAARERFPEVPGIIVSGAIGEEVAIEAVKGGATDYVLKQRLGRLGPAVRRALQEVRQLAERKRVEQALRESEERFRLLIEAVRDCAILMLDPRGRVATWNAGAERIKGYTAQEITGQDFSRFYPPEDIAAGRPQQALAIAARQGQYADEGWRLRRDGSRFWASVTITAVLDEAGLLRGFAKVTRDLTERKQAEEQLRELNTTLEQRVAERTADAERRAGQLRALAAQLTHAEQKERQRLAEILHDHLQQLLVGTKFHLGILRGELKGPQQRELLKQVDNLLDESLDASRSLTLDLCPPILQQGTMAQVLAWLGEWFDAKHGLTVEVLVDTEAIPLTQEVQVLLFQAVRELLFNVVKHAKVRQASVVLARAGDGQIKVVVSDAGEGFDPSRPQVNRHEGSGFGLFNIRERLEWLGGSLEIQSAPGQGTRATLIAPIRLKTQSARVPVALEIAPAAGTQASSPAAVASGGKIRVVLADDHAVVRDGLSRLLQTQPNIEVVGHAADGRQVVELTQQLQPDVVIMDVNMAYVDGVEATRHIKTHHPRVQVIGLSMFTEPAVAEAMKAAGAVAYLAKTSGPDALIAAIHAAVTEGP